MSSTVQRQLTLVLFYGPKPDAFAQWLAQCRALVSAALGAAFSSAFAPYDELQTHATLISLEHTPGTTGENLWFRQHRGVSRGMDFAGLLEFLRRDARLPLRVRLGGWAPDEAPFTSSGRTPYARSFSVQGDKVVLMGWALAADGSFPDTLHTLRADCARFGLLHKYFRTPADRDNDCYLRLGLLRAPVPDAARQHAEHTLREYLRQHPITLDVTLADLHAVAYVDEPLTYTLSQHWRLDDPQLTGALLAGVVAGEH